MSEQLLTARELEAHGMILPIKLSAEQLEAERFEQQALAAEIQESMNASQE